MSPAVSARIRVGGCVAGGGKITLQEELCALLKKPRVGLDEGYLWDCGADSPAPTGRIAHVWRSRRFTPG
jgi:hypothetical protein